MLLHSSRLQRFVLNRRHHLQQIYVFHEGGNTGSTPLTPAAQAVQKAMQQSAPGSSWLIQAWGHNPHKDLVAGTDPKHTIILALDKDMTAGHDK